MPTLPAKRQERAARLREADLYVVTCEPLSEGRTDFEILDAAIAAGVKLVQLRDKECSAATLYEKAVEFRRRTAEANVLLIINNRVDVAMAVDADGVHLGQSDFPVAVAREMMPDHLIGASTHNLEQALEAQHLGADYLNVGPIYPTKTKGGLSEFLGIEAVREIAPQLTIPFTVMGGIKTHHIPELCDAGARIIALVTAVTAQPDPTAAAKALRQVIQDARK